MKHRKKTSISKYSINYSVIAIMVIILIVFVAGIYFMFFRVPDKNPVLDVETPWEKASRLVKYPENIPVIAENENPVYAGIGQVPVENQAGYFTTFTTTEEKKYIEYKQNGIAPWAENEYWYETMAKSGCGITAMSIILSGYGYEETPEDLRLKYQPYMDYESLTDELIYGYGIEASRFYYDDYSLSAEKIQEHLLKGSPVLVCVWDEEGCLSGEESERSNRWTMGSHYMALLAADGEGKVYVSNPNGLMNKGNSSGWYDIEEITPYLAKLMYID